jgi:hypothetical protein
MEDVEASQYQFYNIKNALLEFAKTSKDPKMESEAESLICN